MLTLGGYNLTDTRGRITWNNLVRPDYWTVELSKVELGDWEVPLSSSQAMIDTGTSYTVIPQKDFTTLFDYWSK